MFVLQIPEQGTVWLLGTIEFSEVTDYIDVDRLFNELGVLQKAFNRFHMILRCSDCVIRG